MVDNALYGTDMSVGEVHIPTVEELESMYEVPTVEEAWEAVVQQAADRARGGIPIVDTAFFWAAPSGMGAENDPGIMQAVYAPLVSACKGNTAVVATAHTVKGFDRWPDDEADISAIRGSGAVVASSSVVTLYKKPKDQPNGNVRFFRVARSRYGDKPGDRYVRLAVDGMETVSALQFMMEAASEIEEKVLALVRQLQPVANPDLEKAWTGDVKDLRSAKRALHETNMIYTPEDSRFPMDVKESTGFLNPQHSGCPMKPVANRNQQASGITHLTRPIRPCRELECAPRRSPTFACCNARDGRWGRSPSSWR